VPNVLFIEFYIVQNLTVSKAFEMVRVDNFAMTHRLSQHS
jgi:hypothetical protein